MKRQHSATYDPEELRRYMLSQPDERLLEIVTLERAQYIQPALNLAEAELRLRGVPFTVPPPAPVKPISHKLGKRLLLMLGYMLTYALLTLEGFVGHYLYWLYANFSWLCQMIIGGVIAFCIVYALFWTAEQMLSWLRRAHIP